MADKTRLVVGLTKDAKKDINSFGGKERKWIYAVLERLETDYDTLKESKIIEPLEDKKGKKGTKLAGYFKIKNAGMGFRIVLDISEDGMCVEVVGLAGGNIDKDADLIATVIAYGPRADEKVYKTAEKRKNRIVKNQNRNSDDR